MGCQHSITHSLCLGFCAVRVIVIELKIYKYGAATLQIFALQVVPTINEGLLYMCSISSFYFLLKSSQ